MFAIVDTGWDDVMGDESIFRETIIFKNIETWVWLAANNTSLFMNSGFSRPHLIGNYSLTLQAYLMKSSSSTDAESSPNFKG